MKGEMQSIKGEIRGMKDEIYNLKHEMEGMKGEIHNVKNEMEGMKGEIHNVKHEIDGMKDDILDMKSQINSRFDVLDIRTSTLEMEIANVKQDQQEIKAKQQIVFEQMGKLSEFHKETMSRFEQLATKQDLEYFDLKISQHEREIYKIKNHA